MAECNCGDSDSTTVGLDARVQEVIDTIRPLLQADGGDIELVSVDAETGKVSVRLQGACKGCPGAAMTLKMGVERHLKEKVPEVTEVVAVQ
ncbi:MAG: NifU family protein [Phycisphaerae bacterium]|nr:NifU family protein [Phycisphaerae bacterium]